MKEILESVNVVTPCAACNCAHRATSRSTTLPVPAAGAGEVVLRVLAAGLCQTDLHIRSAADSRTPDGTTLGHEIAGVVEEIGAGVTQWRPGDRVVVHPCWSCGACSACLAGRQNACRRTGGRLNPPPTPGVTKNGGMAEYVSAPASALVRSAISIPRSPPR